MASRIKATCSSVNLKLAMNLRHSSRPANTVNSPLNGLLRKNKSNLKKKTHYFNINTIAMPHKSEITNLSPTKCSITIHVIHQILQ